MTRNADDTELADLTQRLKQAVEALDRLEVRWSIGSRKERTARWLDFAVGRLVSPWADAQRRRQWLLEEIAETMREIEQLQKGARR